MNAAARLVHQNVVTRHLVLANALSIKYVGVLFLGLALLMSALGTIYITQLTRELHAAYQRSLVVQGKLQSEQSQLLLERSSLLTQARLQQIAEYKLGMTFPDYHSSFIIHE